MEVKEELVERRKDPAVSLQPGELGAGGDLLTGGQSSCSTSSYRRGRVHGAVLSPGATWQAHVKGPVNIFLPLVLAGNDYKNMKDKLTPIAVKLGITDILGKYPYEVSGGQKQRAAVARALITDPKIILADEPTGALDSRSSDELLRLFGEVNAAGQTILMVTHSAKAASNASRVLFIRDGEVFHQIYRGQSTNALFYQKITETLTLLSQGGNR